MKAGDLVRVNSNHTMDGNKWWKGQPGFIVEVADYGSRIRVMIAGKTAWFFYYHLRKL